MAWVLTNSPYDGGARTLHIVLAHHADRRRRVQRPQAQLASDCALDAGHLRRLVRQLVDDGAVEIEAQPVGRTPAVLVLMLDRPRAVARATDDVDRAASRAQPESNGASAPPLLDNNDLGEQKPPRRRRKRPPSPNEPVAREIVDRVWVNRSPRPAAEYMTLVTYASKLLDAGHGPERVEQAFMTVATVTLRSCEFWLNNGHATAGPTTAVDDDRGGETGRVQL